MSFTQQQALKLLQRAEQQQRLPHALLITGSELAGTHDLALNMVQTLNGVSAPSLDELAHAQCRLLRPSSRSRSILVDDIREIEQFLSLCGEDGAYKIVIILDAERMSEEASNAFLKTLEEPPAQTLIMLLSEHPSRLLATILSRCIRLDLREQGHQLHLSEVQQLFLPLLLEALAQLGDDIAALVLSAEIQQLLISRKEEITQRQTLTIKQQAKTISEGTGIRDWEAMQKEITAAHIEAEYLREREEIFELFTLCFGQVILHASHTEHAALISPLLATLADKHTPAELMQRMRALDALREDLKYNVKDSLALDVRLVDVIGKGLRV